MFKIGDKLTKENYTQGAVWCNKNNATINPVTWVIEAIPEPTEKEVAQARIAELKRMLADTDYIVIKLAEDAASREEYAEELAQRAEWRKEINDLEATIAKNASVEETENSLQNQ